MLKELKRSQWEENLQQFMDQFQTPPGLKLVSFHPIQLPVVVAEAHTKMHSVQDYSVLSLLILRLFDAGITSPEAIQSICGLSAETVRIYIEKEMVIQEHIDPETNRLTELGLETLKANENIQDGMVRSCRYYDSVLRVHVDPITASLIPQYLEWELADNLVPNQDAGDFLKPRASADVDECFRKELRDRLIKEINEHKEEYVTLDTIQNGDILNSVTAFRPLRIFYRWGYLAKFEGMRVPMIVLTGRIAVDTVNAESVAAGVKSKNVAMPIAIANSDKDYLLRCGIDMEKVLSREDVCFDELLRVTRKMRLTMPGPDGTVLSCDPEEDDDQFYDEFANEYLDEDDFNEDDDFDEEDDLSEEDFDEMDWWA